MFDEAPLTWVDAPPPPPADAAVLARARDVAAVLARGEAVTLIGASGSGRRTTALHAVAALTPRRAYVVPAIPWRAPEALREIARQVGVVSPGGLPPETLLTLATGALADAPGGVIVVDARLHADPALLAMLRPPPGWGAVLLAPSGVAPAVAWGARLELPVAAVPAPIAADDAAVLAATAWFDPWEGAPRALLAAIADRQTAATEAALDRLLARGHLRPARDARRVLPPVALHVSRPAPTDVAGRGPAERFVATLAAWCKRTGDDGGRLLVDDRANVMTALALWRDLAPPGLVAGFAHALPMLVEDVGCHVAIDLIVAAERFGDDATPALIARARRLMSPR